jgi:hypothetical protein
MGAEAAQLDERREENIRRKEDERLKKIEEIKKFKVEKAGERAKDDELKAAEDKREADRQAALAATAKKREENIAKKEAEHKAKAEALKERKSKAKKAKYVFCVCHCVSSWACFRRVHATQRLS